MVQARARRAAGVYALMGCVGAALVFALCHRRTGSERVAARTSADSARDRDSAMDIKALHTEGATQCQSPSTPVDAKLLARLLQNLKSRRSHAARCAKLVTLRSISSRSIRGTTIRCACAIARLALGHSSSPAAISSLLQLARTSEAPLREPLVQALASRAEPGAHATLIGWARDRSSLLRVPATSERKYARELTESMTPSAASTYSRAVITTEC